MESKVRAEYDFSGMPGSGELTIQKGEILAVIHEGIEGGWIEGKNAKGKVGLFPEAYVSKVPSQNSAPPPTMAPPPLPPIIPSAPTYSIPPVVNPVLPPSQPARAAAAGRGALPLDAWDDPTIPVVAPPYIPPGASSSTNHSQSKVPSASQQVSYPNLELGAGAASANSHHFDDDFDDDEWSDEDEEITEINQGSTGGAVARAGAARSRSTGPESTTGSVSAGKAGSTSRMKNINRFSNFVKTGMEAYILATAKMNMQPGERHEIIVDGNRIEWHRNPQQSYNCVIDKPKKESKLKGLKSFIAYSLTSSLTGIQVSRRYKHFDWLHEQLSNKYILIPIPPLPEKQVAGRYEEDLIEHRRSILQLWVNRICHHPVLSQSEVWKHFISCTDERRWKDGKRKAEKDEYVGGSFFNCITAPPEPADNNKIEKQVELYARHVRSLDDSTRNMYERVSEMQKRIIGPYKAHWQKLAGTFETLGQSMDLDQTQTNNPVANAIKTSAHVLHKIGAQHEDHAKRDIEQLLDHLYINKGQLVSVPDIVNVHKSALAKVRDNERLQHEGRISAHDADAIRQRVDVTTYAMAAEINHLSEERDRDFRQMFGTFFAQEAAFYNAIGRQMAELAEQFNAK